MAITVMGLAEKLSEYVRRIADEKRVTVEAEQEHLVKVRPVVGATGWGGALLLCWQILSLASCYITIRILCQMGSAPAGTTPTSKKGRATDTHQRPSARTHNYFKTTLVINFYLLPAAHSSRIEPRMRRTHMVPPRPSPPCPPPPPP